MAKQSVRNQARKNRVQEHLRDIIAMFDVLGQSYDGLSDKSGITEEFVRFDGFDAHDPEDFEYLEVGYEMTARGQEPRVFESHSPRLTDYLAMVERWQSSKNPMCLTREDVVRIVHG